MWQKAVFSIVEHVLHVFVQCYLSLSLSLSLRSQDSLETPALGGNMGGVTDLEEMESLFSPLTNLSRSK